MKLSKRILSLLVVLAMVLSFVPQFTLAAEEAYTGNRPTILMVGGVSVDVSQDASGDTWAYDYETNTLTVTGNILVTATGDAKDSGIYVDQDLNVVFSGNAEEIQVDGTYGIYSESGNLHITTTEGIEAYFWTTYAAAIQTSGDVVIDGSGELNALSHINQQGIRANNLTVREVTQLYADEITVAQSMTVENAFLWCISGATVGGALTIENSHVRVNSEQAAFASENCSAVDSVVFNGNSIYVAGNAALRADEWFGSDDTVTYGYGATLDTGDYNFSVKADAVIYTTAEDGTVTQHIHNTDGGIDYEDYDNSQYHFTTKICAGCPAGYVYRNAEDHEFGADGLCVYCGAAVRYDLIIDGVMVNVHNADDILGDGTASYDTGTNTLTLNNANITDGMYTNEDMAAGIGIMAAGALTIELVGDSFVSAASSDTMSCGIFCQGALTFSGSGTLTVGCGTGEQMSGALFAAVVTVEEETTVTAENTVIAMDLTNHGTLNALVGKDMPSYTYEVYGNVTLTEDLAVTQGADGDSEHGSITITEGAVLTVADGVTFSIGSGRTDKKDVIINNSKVILEGTGTIVNNGTGSCGETATHCYQNGVCLICLMECTHDYENGVCMVCGMTCTHENIIGGKCSVCGLDCSHEVYENGFCKRCGAYEPAVQNADGYYEIGNAGQLYWFADKVNNGGEISANAILIDNIVVNENVLKDDGSLNGTPERGWTPIANSSDNQFTGTFDGGSYTISGLYFNDSAASYVGLFGYVSGTVQNVGVADSYLHGKYSVGGIAGYVFDGTVTNCYNAGAVSCANSPVGGVVGYNYGKITDCYNIGYVSGRNNYVGGVVGQNKSGTVINCYNSGTVTSTSGQVGGVVGQNDSGTVTNCYNTGTVSGSIYYVGGVVGYNPYGTVENCYNAGYVSGELDVGGVVGASTNGNCSVTNCYNTGTVSGSRNYVGGVLGHMYSGTFANCYNTGTVSGSGDYVGGVVSYINGGTVTNCYYLGTEETDSIDGTTYKTTEQFASGEVCWLLNGSSVEGVWGQKLETHVLPILGEPKVCYKEGFGYYNIQGWTEQNGFWYYYDPETGKAVTGISRVPYPAEAIGGVTYAPNAADLAGDPSYGYTDGETSLFIFDENGVFQNELNGKYMDGETMHWAVNGQLPWHVGLVQDGEDYYYFLGENVMVTGNTYMARNTTELDVVTGGIYTFGADGKMYLYDGVGEVNGTLYYYENYRLVMGAGLVKLDGNYYYVRSNGAVVADQRYWVSNVNEYTDITPGFYVFDKNGVMQLPEHIADGIYEEDGGLYYYENGHRTGKGLIQYSDGENYDGDWIYVRSNGQLATGRYWTTTVGDSGFAQGFYAFDEMGRMLPAKNGIVEEYGRLYYYVDDIKQYALGLVELEDGSYIYVRSNGILAVGRYWVTNTNGYMDQGFRNFGEDGRMIVQ